MKDKIELIKEQVEKASQDIVDETNELINQYLKEDGIEIFKKNMEELDKIISKKQTYE